MKWHVFSRPAFEATHSFNTPHVVVSINCPGEEPARFSANELTLARTNLFFWDMDAYPPGADQTTCPLITDDDAEKIINMIDANPGCELVVHCTAGKSRSAAVVAALLYCYTGNDMDVFDNPRYKPNMRVYRKILNAWTRKHTSADMTETNET